MRLPILGIVLLALALPARAADKKEIAAHVFSLAGAVADVETTARAVRGGHCTEANPFIGPRPSRARLYAVTLPTTAWFSYVSHWAHARHKKWWAIPALANGAVHFGAAEWNSLQGC